MTSAKACIDPNLPRTIRPATKDDRDVLVLEKMHDQFEATLTVRFPDALTAVADDGKIVRGPVSHGIAGLTLILYGTVAYSAPPQKATLTIDLNIEHMEKFLVAEYQPPPSLDCLSSPEGCVSAPTPPTYFSEPGAYISGDGGTTVALLKPVKGATCWGSPGQIGDQFPVATSDYAHEIVNISAIQADNSTGTPDIVGWEYMTGNGDVYIQENMSFKSFWTGLAEAIPTLGSFVQVLDAGGITTITSTEGTDVINYTVSHSGEIGSCFSNSLPA